MRLGQRGQNLRLLDIRTFLSEIGTHHTSTTLSHRHSRMGIHQLYQLTLDCGCSLGSGVVFHHQLELSRTLVMESKLPSHINRKLAYFQLILTFSLQFQKAIYVYH